MAFLLVNDELKYKIVTTLIPTEDKLYKVYSYSIYVIWKSQNPIALHVYTNSLLQPYGQPFWVQFLKFIHTYLFFFFNLFTFTNFLWDL